MGIEIERKFLVNNLKWNAINKPEGEIIRQKYILTDEEKTIRIREKGNKGYFTIKGKKKGITRTEFEFEIPLEQALEMMKTFSGGMISKVRYKINFEGKLWEIDEFLDDNIGLIVAEIELRFEDETFSVPDWVAKEVTHDTKYYNSNLAIKPFNRWKKKQSDEE